MTKIMMTGASGKVGKELAKYGVLPLVGDVTKAVELNDTVSKEKPDVIIHLASLSNPDFCEKKENEERVIRVNLRGTFNVCEAAEGVNAQVILLSTDHVFDGGKGFLHKRGPYKETDKPNPLNFYGHSKLSAEALQQTFDNLWVVRTSYLFDWDRLDLGNETQMSRYPDFIYRSFMYLPHFVESLYLYSANLDRVPKLIHISGSKTTSWFKFMSCLVPNLSPRKYDLENDYSPRPKYGGLKTKYRNLFPSYSYLDGIEQMMKDRQ